MKNKARRYPEYISGVKQEQNPIKRLAIRIWYSDIVRIVFILLGLWWQVPLELFAAYEISKIFNVPFNQLLTDMKLISIVIYVGFIALGFIFNDYNNLRRIGRYNNGQKIEATNNENKK